MQGGADQDFEFLLPTMMSNIRDPINWSNNNGIHLKQGCLSCLSKTRENRPRKKGSATACQTTLWRATFQHTRAVSSEQLNSWGVNCYLTAHRRHPTLPGRCHRFKSRSHNESLRTRSRLLKVTVVVFKTPPGPVLENFTDSFFKENLYKNIKCFPLHN